MNPMAIAQPPSLPTVFPTPTSPAVNTPKSVMISSVPSACDSVTAVNQKNAIQKIMDFLKFPQPVDNNDIYTDLTEQLITQTRKDKTLSSSELTFSIFKYKVKINIFDTKQQQLSFLEKMSIGHMVYEDMEIKGGVYSHSRRQAIIDYYGRQPYNSNVSEAITSREINQLQKMSERDIVLNKNNYDFLFLKYLKSIILASDFCSNRDISTNTNNLPSSSCTLKNKTQQLVCKNNETTSNKPIQKTSSNNNENNIFSSEENISKNPEVTSDSLNNTVIKNTNSEECEKISSSSEEMKGNNFTQSTNIFSDAKVNVAISATQKESTTSPVEDVKNNEIQQEKINSLDSTHPDVILVNYDDREGVISEDINERVQIPVEEFKNVKAEMVIHGNSSCVNINSKSPLSPDNKKTKKNIQPRKNKNREKSFTDSIRKLIFTWKFFTKSIKGYITEKHNTNDSELFLWNLSRHIFSAHTTFANGITYDADSIYLHLESTDYYKNNSQKLNSKKNQKKFLNYLKANFIIEHAIKCETVKEGSASKKTDENSFEIKADHNPASNKPFDANATSTEESDILSHIFNTTTTDTLQVLYGNFLNEESGGEDAEGGVVDAPSEILTGEIPDDCSDSVPPEIVLDDVDNKHASDSMSVNSDSESSYKPLKKEPKRLVVRRYSMSS